MVWVHKAILHGCKTTFFMGAKAHALWVQMPIPYGCNANFRMIENDEGGPGLRIDFSRGVTLSEVSECFPSRGVRGTLDGKDCCTLDMGFSFVGHFVHWATGLVEHLQLTGCILCTLTWSDHRLDTKPWKSRCSVDKRSKIKSKSNICRSSNTFWNRVCRKIWRLSCICQVPCTGSCDYWPRSIWEHESIACISI